MAHGTVPENKGRTLQVIEGPQELLRILEDVNTDEEVSGMLLVLLKEVVESVRGLEILNKAVNIDVPLSFISQISNQGHLQARDHHQN